MDNMNKVNKVIHAKSHWILSENMYKSMTYNNHTIISELSDHYR